jgi:hypothetical protein
MDPISVTYRSGRNGWEVFLSSGQQLTISASPDEAGLTEARAAVRRHLAGRVLGAERVDTTVAEPIEWHGLRFELLATTHGLEDPTPAQADQLRACWEHYRTNLPPDMKVELYGNRIRIEPGAFGRRAAVINALGGLLAAAAPDEHDLVVAPHSSGADQAREQFCRARNLPVPDGFIRIVNELSGFEDEGAIGAIYLVLKDRWELDRPW